MKLAQLKPQNQTLQILVSRAFLLTALFLGACVTVNVNFPESAVQKATDDYVRELYRAKQKDTEGSKGDQSRFDWSLIASAQADELAIKMDSPVTQEITARISGRAQSVLKFKRQGYLGETAEGVLVVKGEPKAILRKKIDEVVAAENADREALYKEVMTSNGFAHNNESRLRASFAKSFQNESPSGTWVERTPGTWEQKR